MDFLFNVASIEITTARVKLRPLQHTDLLDFHAYASIPGVGELAGWPYHKDLEQSRQVLDQYINEGKYFAIYHLADRRVIGQVALGKAWINRHPKYQDLKAKNISYALSPSYWGRGLVPEVVEALIDYGFNTLGIQAFGVEHFVHNVQSQRVIEKLGFTLVQEGTYHAKELGQVFAEYRYVLLQPDRQG